VPLRLVLHWETRADEFNYTLPKARAGVLSSIHPPLNPLSESPFLYTLAPVRNREGLKET
jgi:hypothetical protein